MTVIRRTILTAALLIASPLAAAEPPPDADLAGRAFLMARRQLAALDAGLAARDLPKEFEALRKPLKDAAEGYHKAEKAMKALGYKPVEFTWPQLACDGIKGAGLPGFGGGPAGGGFGGFGGTGGGIGGGFGGSFDLPSKKLTPDEHLREILEGESARLGQEWLRLQLRIFDVVGSFDGNPAGRLAVVYSDQITQQRLAARSFRAMSKEAGPELAPILAEAAKTAEAAHAALTKAAEAVKK